MLSSSRPPETRWNVAACWAASVGAIAFGRKATRNFSRRVSASSAEVTIHESSHHVPVGVRTPVKPRSSAARAIWARYSMRGGRRCPSGPNGMTVRLSPDVGRNQCRTMPLTGASVLDKSD